MANPLPFQNKSIAITGAASGIGLATAHHLAARGASLSLADISAPALASAAPALSLAHGTPVMYRVVDVTSSAAVNAWIAETLEKYGRLDGAVNAAGMNGGNPPATPIWDVEEDVYAAIQGVNVTGVWNCMRAELRGMGCGDASLKISSHTTPPATGAPGLGTRGCVVNVASIAGVAGRKGSSAYVASKHAVVGMSKSAAMEAGEWGVRVNVVAPGYVDTPMMVYIQDEVERLSLKRVGKPEEMAGLIAWVLGGEGSAYVTGEYPYNWGRSDAKAYRRGLREYGRLVLRYRGSGIQDQCKTG